MLQFIGSQRVGHDLVTEQQQACLRVKLFIDASNLSINSLFFDQQLSKRTKAAFTNKNEPTKSSASLC